MPRLGVNVDHVATLRQARRGERPSPVWAAREAEAAGCDSIVCHLREDRRHIQDADLPALKKALRIPLNLEMAAHPEIVRIACRVRPHQATLVPERRRELTTEGGLDLGRGARRLTAAVRALSRSGIRVSLFIDPSREQVRRAALLEAPMIELHTGAYAQARTPSQRGRCFRQLRDAAQHARHLGLVVAAGHGLDYGNVGLIAAIPEIEELNIGFSVVARAIEVGLPRAVKEMLQAISPSSRARAYTSSRAPQGREISL